MDGGATWVPRRAIDASPGDQWFPWADYPPDGTLHVAYDSNEGRGGDADRDDTFNHVYMAMLAAGSTSREGARAGRHGSHKVGKPGHLSDALGRAVHHRLAGDLWPGRLHRGRRAGGEQ
ncbi:MAG: hypothetical protein WKF82_08630 [Nocardioidaceae bacterium]